jgi:membrane-bound transcription factor site-1 protease
VAGAVALLASTVAENIRWDVINPASMKQALVESAERLDEANIFEQVPSPNSCPI